MRLSADRTDPGYQQESLPRARVFLDGRLLKYCITADEELGEVLMYETDACGKLLCAGYDQLSIVQKFGKVEIKLEPCSELL